MASKKQVVRDGVKILGPLDSGAGDPALTRDASSKDVGEIPPIDNSAYLSTALQNGYIFIGDSNNIATPRLVSGMISLTNLGVANITANSILNAHINSAAGIVYSKLNLTNSIINNDISAIAAIDRTKLASGNAWRVIINNASGVMSEAAAITPSRVLVSDVNGIPVAGAASTTEASYLVGVTSGIQNQINNRLAFSSSITPSEGDIVYYNGSVWLNLPRGSTGQVLTSTATTISMIWCGTLQKKHSTSILMIPPLVVI